MKPPAIILSCHTASAVFFPTLVVSEPSSGAPLPCPDAFRPHGMEGCEGCRVPSSRTRHNTDTASLAGQLRESSRPSSPGYAAKLAMQLLPLLKISGIMTGPESRHAKGHPLSAADHRVCHVLVEAVRHARPSPPGVASRRALPAIRDADYPSVPAVLGQQCVGNPQQNPSCDKPTCFLHAARSSASLAISGSEVGSELARSLDLRCHILAFLCDGLFI